MAYTLSLSDLPAAPQSQGYTLTADDLPQTKEELAAKKQAMLSKLEAMEQPNLLRYPGDFASGMAKGVYDLANFGAKKLFNKTLPEPTSITEPQNNDMSDRVAHAFGEYAPFNAVGDLSTAGKVAEVVSNPAIRNILAQTVAGAGYGAATNPDNAASGAATGAVIGAGAGTLGAAASKGIQAGSKALSTASIHPFLAKIKDTFENADLPGMQNIANALKNNYLKVAGKSEELFPAVNASADAIDKNFPQSFDSTDYINTLKAKRAEIQDTVGNNKNLQKQYSVANDQLNNLIYNPPAGFRDAVRERQGINAIPDNYFSEKGQTNKKLGDVVSTAKNALIDQVNKNIEAAPNVGDFGDLWSSANKNYEAQQAFKQLPNVTNKLEDSADLQKAMHGGEMPDAGIMNKFLPAKTDEGLSKFNHLETLLGDPVAAKNALRSTFMNNAMKDGANPQKIVNAYKTLSETQRGYLFTNEERHMLDSVISAKAGSVTQSKLLARVGHWGAGALLGGAVAEHEKQPVWMGMVTGGLAGEGASHGLGELAATQVGQNILKHMANARLKGTSANVAGQNFFNNGGSNN